MTTGHSTDIEYCDPFDQPAPDFWMKVEHLGRYIFAAELALELDAHRVLDAACANGYGCRELARSGAHTVGVDVHADYLRDARRAAEADPVGRITYVEGDLDRDDLPRTLGGDYDLITSFETLEHLTRPAQALAGFADLLRGGGRLLLSVPNRAFEPVTSDGAPRNPFHKQLFTLDDIRALVEGAGLHVRRVLAQPYTNIFFNRERQLCKAGLAEKDDLPTFYRHDERAIRHFARLFGMPEESAIDVSYAILLDAERPGSTRSAAARA